ncbi:DUF4233 domain-containing protein [Mycolicibacterium neoaurum]|uniref:DUF4233 domain-containing protein n=1 Tax=Mycolicibacterium neoaurum TaxID=1795 RepID=UPI002672C22F|nr:DUF4233 domain-containing protein [Mycolicibacterium neoaurum]MDO3398815.1 DUF4233 domain-containing protein [Mycolicibacterium neoaurum]
MSDASERPVTPGTPPDPWKSFRGIMAGTLILEAIVALLALPVVANGAAGLTVASGAAGLTVASGGFLIGAAVVLVLMSGVQGRPGIIWVNLGVQFVLIAGALVHAAIGFIGVVFAAVWALIIYLRAEVKRRQDRGQLPSQQAARRPDAE